MIKLHSALRETWCLALFFVCFGLVFFLFYSRQDSCQLHRKSLSDASARALAVSRVFNTFSQKVCLTAPTPEHPAFLSVTTGSVLHPQGRKHSKEMALKLPYPSRHGFCFIDTRQPFPSCPSRARGWNPVWLWARAKLPQHHLRRSAMMRQSDQKRRCGRPNGSKRHQRTINDTRC